jgi:hypothetical protein
MTRYIPMIGAALALIVSGCALGKAKAGPDEAHRYAAFETVKRQEQLRPAPAIADDLVQVAQAPVLLPPYMQPAAAPAPVVNVAPAAAPIVHVAPAAVTVAPAAPVVVGWGDWAAEFAKWAGSAALAAFAISRGLIFGLVKNPLLRMALEAYFTNDRVNELVGVAIAKVEGAAKGKTLTVDVGNKVLAAAVQQALETLPNVTINMLGGADGIRDKILSKLDLEEAASAATVG